MPSTHSKLNIKTQTFLEELKPVEIVLRSVGKMRRENDGQG
jgi:hypothetical protein